MEMQIQDALVWRAKQNYAEPSQHVWMEKNAQSENKNNSDIFWDKSSHENLVIS